MKLPGKLTISRPRSNRGDDMISIELVDTSSGCHIVHVTMDLAPFAQALTNLGYMPCEFELLGVKSAGKKREVKTERITLPSRTSNRRLSPEERAAILAPYEVDGWIGTPDDLTNGHRLRYDADGGIVASVSFVRFVEPEERAEAEAER